jgi:hypothetical protein
VHDKAPLTDKPTTSQTANMMKSENVNKHTFSIPSSSYIVDVFWPVMTAPFSGQQCLAVSHPFLTWFKGRFPPLLTFNLTTVLSSTAT